MESSILMGNDSFFNILGGIITSIPKDQVPHYKYAMYLAYHAAGCDEVTKRLAAIIYNNILEMTNDTVNVKLELPK